MRQMTWTCDRALELIRSVDSSELGELLERADVIRGERGSERLGFRHLVMAAGLPWRSPGPAAGGGQADHGSGS